MKKSIIYTLLFLVVLMGSIEDSYAWGNKSTHPAITKRAGNSDAAQIDNYLKTQLGFSQGLSTQLHWDFPEDVRERLSKGQANPEITTRSVLDWLGAGSTIEDEDGRWKPIRPRHHFHDPIRNSGLDNQTDHPEWRLYASSWSGFDFTGTSSLTWAIQGIAQKEPTINEQTWDYARQGFYLGLISSSQSYREACMAIAFVDLGQVIHLVEDLGVPAHARNDFLFGHYRSWHNYGNPFEGWVEEQVEDSNGQCSWLGAGPVVFDKLAKYFDANVYTGGYLGDGITPPEGLWGLSECTNYQFLSFSTVFGCSGVKYQFPHPAEDHTTIQKEGNKTFFNGSNYGVSHLARDSYTRYVAAGFGYTYVPVIDSTITTDDVNVFEDYADITIPRTIDHATGLLNYFFRGRLSVEPSCVSPDCNQIELTITNDSNNSGVPQTLKGGSFELYRDDEEGARAQVAGFTVPGWNPASTLGYGQSVTGQFTKPTPSQGHQISKYILVYKGQINANPAQPDADDPNAMAVDTFAPPEPPPSIAGITPEMGCPGSVLLIEGSGFSATPAENVVRFEDVNGVYPDVYGNVLSADVNGTWLTVELPFFDADDVDYFWTDTTVTVDGNTSDPYAFKLTNYIWCTITLWDAGEEVDDEFDLYINSEYITTSYLAPPSAPTIVEIGFWYADDYHFVDTYLYDSYGIPGGTLAIIIEPYVDRIVGYRWNSNTQQQEFLFDYDYSGIFAAYFGSDVLVNPDDGVELDVYLSMTYSEASRGEGADIPVVIGLGSPAEQREARGNVKSIDEVRRDLPASKTAPGIKKRLPPLETPGARKRPLKQEQ